MAEHRLGQSSLYRKKSEVEMGILDSVEWRSLVDYQRSEIHTSCGLELSVYGWVQMLAGFAILAGSAVFYSNQSRYMQGSATILVAASMSWVAVILIAIRVVSGTAYVSGVLTIFLVLAPLLSTIGSVWNLISGETKSIKR